MSKTLWPISCAHIGAKDHRADLLDQYIKQAKRGKWDVILIGDLIDCGLFSGTAHIDSVWDNTMTPAQQMEEAVKVFDPIKSQIMSVMAGNHPSRIFKVTSLQPEKIIAKLLKVPFVSNAHTFKWNGLNLMAAHGTGRTDDVKARLRHEGVDLFLLGHTHELGFWRYNRLTGSAGLRRNIWFVRCGSFLDTAEYAKFAMYPPTPIGSPVITIAPMASNKRGLIQCQLGI
jgi:UDP-2,3-diacylglucosamine pyrophosphatase LpxH